MPRASWRGFLRLSLVSCPIYLAPATLRAKPVRLHQVWVPHPEPADRDERPAQPRPADPEELDAAAPAAVTRVALRPHDPDTGAEIEREDVLKGYEYERGRFVTLSKDELKALDIESTKIVDLETFVPRAEIDPVYFDTPYYVHPDGAVAAEAFRVIAAALTQTGMAGIGRIVLSRRERMVTVAPRAAGMVLITLRSADQVRPAQFAAAEAPVDAEMVAIATMIIKRKAGAFDPSSFRDRYQEALQALIEAKLKGLPITPRPIAAPRPAGDLMAALKRSLVEAEKPRPGKKPAADRRQRSLLLPVAGGRDAGTGRQASAGAVKAANSNRRRKL